LPPKGLRVAILFSLVIANFLILSFPYFVKWCIVPVGWDAAWYVRNMRLIADQGLLALFEKTGGINFYCVFEYFLSSIFHVSFTLTEKVLPIVIGVSYSLVNFKIVRKFSKSWKLPLIAMGLSIVAFNTARMVQDLHRNLFCFLLVQVALFLILPDILENASRKKAACFISLMVLAGISHVETFALAILALFLLLLFYLRKHLSKKTRLLFIYIAIPSLLVFLLESPFLLNYLKGAVFLDQSIKFSYEAWIALPWSYFISLGGALIPFYVIGLYHSLSTSIKNQKEQLLFLISFWNLVIISCSFIPWFGIKIPGYRFLLLATVPVVSTIGFAKFLAYKNLNKKKTALSIVLIALAVATQISYISNNYNPWISNSQYEKLMWIANNKRDDPCTFVLYFDGGETTHLVVEMYGFWIEAVVGSRTNVYFGEISYLLRSESTPSENQFMNETSFAFWSMMKNFTLKNEIYLIKDWYNTTSADQEYLKKVSEGIYQVIVDTTR